MKGVILAGGSGTRLYPLTRITNKHLLPIYDRPMVTYAIEALVMAGVSELMLVSGGTHAGEFFRLLGNGHDYGIDRLFYAYQDRAGGIAEALNLAERFVDRDRVVVILADNVFEHCITPTVQNFAQQESGARILLSAVDEADHLHHLGVPELTATAMCCASWRSPPILPAGTPSPVCTCTTERCGTSCPRCVPPTVASWRSPMSTTGTSNGGRCATTF
jgi:dTDP-glucose pyrophosphorylase